MLKKNSIESLDISHGKHYILSYIQFLIQTKKITLYFPRRKTTLNVSYVYCKPNYFSSYFFSPEAFYLKFQLFFSNLQMS